MKSILPSGGQRLVLAAFAIVSLACSNPLRAFSLSASQVIGYVVPATPADPVDETARLQFFIMLYNGSSAVQPDNNVYTPVFGAALPAVLPSPAVFGTKIPATTFPVTITTPHNYLMAKFGSDAVYYYLGGQTGILESLSVPPAVGPNGIGLSHISLFNPTGGGPTVPDRGATIGLLGGTFLALAFLRRRFAR